MPRNFGPMLAASFEDEEMLDLVKALTTRGVQFPLLASPKIDGIRFMVKDRVAMSRSWKPLPNQFFQDFFKADFYDGLDGEVIIGRDPCALELFNQTQSAIMTRSGVPNFSIHVFDEFLYPDKPFQDRHSDALDRVQGLLDDGVNKDILHKLDHIILRTPEEVVDYERAAIEAGYEGIMLRNSYAKYKFGRSTLREQGLIKIKRFLDAEAKIVGFRSLERNTNPPQKDAFGLQKRSSHKAGKVADELLGKLVVTAQPWGEFEIGSGFDVATREDIWKNQESYRGRHVTFKYQPHGVKDKPRAPIFKGMRPEVDR